MLKNWHFKLIIDEISRRRASVYHHVGSPRLHFDARVKNHRGKKENPLGTFPPPPFPFSPCLLDIGRQVFNFIHFRSNLACFHQLQCEFLLEDPADKFSKTFLVVAVVAIDLSTCSVIDRVWKSVIRVKKKKKKEH